jgi:cytochrome b561
MHSVLAYALFATFLVHLTLVLYHTLVVRDRLLSRMTGWRPAGSADLTKPALGAAEIAGDSDVRA